MSTVREHYESVLAKHYIWMTGVPFEEKVKEQRALIEWIVGQFGLRNLAGMALDLGSGPGFQTIALAELGFSPVIAIDSSAELLREIEVRAGAHVVQIRESDLTALASLPLGGQPVIAVCMGDTLTHLPSREDVTRFFAAVFDKLSSKGIFAITYRDLTNELTGTDRFISVRSDDEKIMTCFLEFENAESVAVNDLIHIRSDCGWILEKSSYRKLRLSPVWVEQELIQAGFHVVSRDAAGRLLLLIAQKQ